MSNPYGQVPAAEVPVAEVPVGPYAPSGAAAVPQHATKGPAPVTEGPSKKSKVEYPFELKLNLTPKMHDLMEIASRKYDIKTNVLGRLAIIEYLGRHFPNYGGE